VRSTWELEVLTVNTSESCHPYVQCKINGQEVKAIIDTGAAVCVIGLHLNKYFKIDSSDKLRAIGGENVAPVGWTKLSIGVGGKRCQTVAAVVNESNYDILLGIEVCQQLGIIINCAKNKVIIEDNVRQINFLSKIEHSVKNDAIIATSAIDVIIPARHVKSIPITVSRPTTEAFYIENAIVNEGLKLVEGSADYLCSNIFVSNNSENDKIIRKKEKLALAYEVAEIDPDDIELSSKVAKSTSAKFDIERFKIETFSSEANTKNLVEVLKEYRDIFAFSSAELGMVDILKHRIKLTDDKKINKPPYRISPKEREHVHELITDMLKNNIIRPSEGAWSSPVVLIRKKDGSI